jgi:serine/threonine protein kinase
MFKGQLPLRLSSLIFVSFLSSSGTLARIPNLIPTPIETILQRHSTFLLEKDLKPAADFIRACTRIDPEERPTADTLCGHEWMRGAVTCEGWRDVKALVGSKAKGP